MPNACNTVFISSGVGERAEKKPSLHRHLLAVQLVTGHFVPHPVPISNSSDTYYIPGAFLNILLISSSRQAVRCILCLYLIDRETKVQKR